AKRRYSGSVSAAFCGFTANTTAAGENAAGTAAISATTVRSAPAAAPAVGAGSTAMDGAKPCSRQPASIALPMRPHPTSKIGGMLMPGLGPWPDPSQPLRLAYAFQHRRCQRILRRLAAPQDELEGRKEPLALGDGDVHHVLQALGRCARSTAQQ